MQLSCKTYQLMKLLWARFLRFFSTAKIFKNKQKYLCGAAGGGGGGGWP